MKNLFHISLNKLPSFSSTSSLLFFTLFCIPIMGRGYYNSSGPVLNLAITLSNSILKIIELIPQILTGLLEGFGGCPKFSFSLVPKT